MPVSPRAAGLSALIFSVATFAAEQLCNTPGGNYDADQVASYIASGNHVTAFIGGYLGLAGVLALIVFVAAMRRRLAAGSRLAADTVWGLGIAAAATAAVGWAIAAGIPIAYAEGGTSGHPVAVSAPTIYVIGEFASLASVYVPQILAGAALLVLAKRLDALPGWLRRFTYLAGVCGIVSPLWLPSFVFLAWGVAFGVWTLFADRVPTAEPALV